MYSKFKLLALGLLITLVFTFPAHAANEWSTSAELLQNIAELKYVAVRMSSDGTKVVAAWAKELAAPNWGIQAAVGTLSGNVVTWETPIDIDETITDPQHLKLEISTDASKATVLWQDYDENNAKYFLRSASATISGTVASWSSPVTITANIDDPGLGFSLALSADGTKAAAHWTISEILDDFPFFFLGTKVSIASISGNTANWSTPETLGESTSYANDIKISSDGSKVVAIWSHLPDTYRLYGAAATISGNVATWGSTVSGLSAVDSTSPSLALSDSGELGTVIYTYNSAILSKSFTVSDDEITWGAETEISPASETPSKPRISLSADGEVAIASFYEDSGTNLYVRSASIADESASFASKSLIDTHASGINSTSDGLSIKLTPDGSTFVTLYTNITSGTVKTSRGTVVNNAISVDSIVNYTADPVDGSWYGFDNGLAISANADRAVIIYKLDDLTDGQKSLFYSAYGPSAPTATATPVNTNTATPTATETPTNTPTFTPSSTPSLTPSATPTNTHTPTATNTPPPGSTATNTPLPSSTATSSPSATATNVASSSATATPTKTSSPEITATNTPTTPSTFTPTATFTATPTPIAIGAGKLEGIVFADDGSPAVGIVIYLYRTANQNGASIKSGTEEGTLSTITDKNGKYKFENVPPATYKVVPNMTGFTFKPETVSVEAGFAAPPIAAVPIVNNNPECTQKNVALEVVRSDEAARSLLLYSLELSETFGRLVKEEKFTQKMSGADSRSSAAFTKLLKNSNELPKVLLTCPASLNNCQNLILKSNIRRYTKSLANLKRLALFRLAESYLLKPSVTYRISVKSKIQKLYRRAIKKSRKLPLKTSACS